MPGPHGFFEGEVLAEWLPDGRRMELRSDFAFVDPAGERWPAPRGSIVDGASIPQVLWTVVGGPFEGPYRKASVIHDVGCDTQTKPWQAVHRMFYEACLCEGSSELRAKVMYAAVYHFGPRWGETIRTIVPMGGDFPGPAAEEVLVLPAEESRLPESEANLKRLITYIEAQDPSLEQLEAFE